MKILILVWNFYPNTALMNHVKATVKGFNKSGARCRVLSIKPLLEMDEDSVNVLFTGVRSFVLTFLGMVWNVIHFVLLAWRYDCIYCETGDLNITKLCIYLAKIYGKKVVHERTEFPDLFYPSSPKGRKNLQRYLKITNSFDCIFCISNPIREYFIENGVDAKKIYIYPMIVDPSRFELITKKTTNNRYIAYCGNLKDSKDGVSDLIRAYGLSCKAKEIFKLYLIGKKPSQLEMQKYDELINKYDISGKVVFTGEVQRDSMPQLLKDADLLVLCRPDNRQALGGVPTKLGEYLSTSNPVLVTAVGDMRIYLKDGENAYVSKPENINSFSNKMDAIAENYEIAMKIGQNGNKLVHSDFNYLVQTNKILNIIKTI